jgi:hypothetical protein
MEGLQPNPLVDMTVVELEVLCNELTDIVENLQVLILPDVERNQPRCVCLL